MKSKSLKVGNQKLLQRKDSVKGDYVQLNGEKYFRIMNYDLMDPFLINVVSSSDHWIYISSNGGLTAGRQNPDNTLFPYINDDQLHDCHETTGSKTIIKVYSENDLLLWEPFSNSYEGIYSIQRNIYKNIPGTKLIFEEINNDLEITFRYSWSTSEIYGFVKESEIINNSNSAFEIELFDGIRNILPSGIYQKIQNDFSTLVDGYKKNELLGDEGIGIFSLSSLPSDRAEPSESLTTTIVWHLGTNPDKYLLTDIQLKNIRKNYPIENEDDVKGRRGSYFINSQLKLHPKESEKWIIVSDINKSTSDVIKLKQSISNNELTLEDILEDTKENNNQLKVLVAKADGLQHTNSALNTSRHFSNTMFNIMRGGIFEDAYSISKKDFIKFIRTANPYVLSAHTTFLEKLPEVILHRDLIESVTRIGDDHFTKLTWEYLPLSFSRRHGDPSRPWNLFSINLKNEYDEKILDYQGNWRDIFQNWEALALSFPHFIESMIVKFLNASTADGYNPYRVTRDGFDWEIQEPENPWANIGYWGDHQVVYLTKLLELSSKYNPDKLQQLMKLEIFTYANVPYRIKKYEEILNDPQDTIVFDAELDALLKQASEEHGTDSKFIKRHDHSLLQVSLIEKLLLVLLVRMSNFVPGGGIWMNTQRPEWNDANNALVGNGISMVTLYYLRRYITYLSELLADIREEEFTVSVEVQNFFKEIVTIIESHKNDFSNTSPATRKIIMDGLGKAGSDYRENVYKNGFSNESRSISKAVVIKLIDLSKQAIDSTIEVNKRGDGLFHSYNILHISDAVMEVTHLYEMLEGQVAVLSSGYLSTGEAIGVIESLRKSKLYREEQNSYILYPAKRLPEFIEKNNIALESVQASKLIQKLLTNPFNGIIESGENDGYHFHSSLNNSSTLRIKLESYLQDNEIAADRGEVDDLLELYEDTFNHKEFTGRSGTFYKYEGLGSIYWHMVSKLLLAVQEVYFDAIKKGASNKQVEKLKKYYYEIKEGIGVEKSPELYGAFPTDAYSHTPSFAGVQQPGMTGQVKEDVISRFGELGIIVENGKIKFDSSLLDSSEFTKEESQFSYVNAKGETKTIDVPANSIAFTVCQIPIIIQLAKKSGIKIIFSNASTTILHSLTIDRETSKSIFSREGNIKLIQISI